MGTSGHPRLTSHPDGMSLGKSRGPGGGVFVWPVPVGHGVLSETQWSLPRLGWSPGPTTCWLVHPVVSLSLSFSISKMELIVAPSSLRPG